MKKEAFTEKQNAVSHRNKRSDYTADGEKEAAQDKEWTSAKNAA